jgi:hypothetical protein
MGTLDNIINLLNYTYFSPVMAKLASPTRTMGMDDAMGVDFQMVQENSQMMF